MATYSPIPGAPHQEGDRRAVFNLARQRSERLGARRPHSRPLEGSDREPAGVGKEPLESEAAIHGRAEGRGHAARDSRSEKRRRRELEPVPGAGDADPGMLGEEPLQPRIGAEVLRDDRGIGAEIEQAPHPLDDEQERSWIGKAHRKGEGWAVGDARHLDDARGSIDGNRPSIAGFFDRFHTGYRVSSEKAEHRVPIVRGAIGQPEPIAPGIGRGDPPSSPPPQLGGSSAERTADLGVEPAEASESRCERHLVEAERGLVEELLGEMNAARERDLERRRADVLSEEPAQMAARDPEAVRQPFDSLAVQSTLADEPQRAGNDPRRSVPGGRSGSGFGPAAQTGAETRGFRGGRRRKIPHVLVLRRARRADRTAVDAGARDGDEESSVEARVPRAAGAIAGQAIQLHPGDSLTPGRAGFSPETDLVNRSYC